MPLQLPAEDLNHIMARTGELWRHLGQGDLLLTGGTGFIGKWLLGSWLHARHVHGFDGQIWVLSRDPSRFLAQFRELIGLPYVHWLEGDVRHSDWWPQQSFRYAIHGATEASAALIRDDPLHMFDVCLQGTRSTLEALRPARSVSHAGGPAPRVLLLSSGAIYGPQPSHLPRVGEDYAGAPDCTRVPNAYAEGKRAAEWLAAVANERWDLPVITARAFAFLGPHLPLDAHYAAGNFLRDAINGGPLRIGGDGTPIRSYLYAADLTIWLWHLLVRGQAGRAYNVGSDHALSILELAQTIARVGVGLDVHPSNPPAPGAPQGTAQRYVPDIARARAELGLEVWVGLEEGIRRTLKWVSSGG